MSACQHHQATSSRALVNPLSKESAQVDTTVSLDPSLLHQMVQKTILELFTPVLEEDAHREITVQRALQLRSHALLAKDAQQVDLMHQIKGVPQVDTVQEEPLTLDNHVQMVSIVKLTSLLQFHVQQEPIEMIQKSTISMIVLLVQMATTVTIWLELLLPQIDVKRVSHVQKDQSTEE